MKKVFVFLAEGFEEIEAISIVDVLRRGDLEVITVSISDEYLVEGAHGIPVGADCLFEEADLSMGDMLVLPGGMPGAANLNTHKGLKEALSQYDEMGKKIAAICAAPLVLGGLGILKNKKATCYPGYESQLTGAEIVPDAVVMDGNIITGKGPGFAMEFGLKIVAELQGKGKADEVAGGMLLK